MGRATRLDLAEERIVGDAWRDALRTAVGVGPADSILEKPDLRAALDHFYERMDRWVIAGADPRIASDSIGEIHPSFDQMVTWRLDDPQTGIYVFAGKRYDLRELARTLASVERRARAAAGKIQADCEAERQRHFARLDAEAALREETEGLEDDGG